MEKDEKLLKKRKLIYSAILLFVGLVCLIVVIILIKRNNDIFSLLNQKAFEVEERIITVDEFDLIYAPLKTKSNLQTAFSIVLILLAIISLTYGFIIGYKTLKKKKKED